MEIVKVTVIGWPEYVRRSDIQRPGWFAFPVKFFQDAEWMGTLSLEMVGALSYVCAQATRSKGEIQVNFSHVTAYLGTSPEAFLTLLQKLEAIQLVHVDVTGTVRARLGNPTATRITNKDYTPEFSETKSERVYEDESGNQSAAPGEPSLPRIAIIWNRVKAEVLAPVKLCGVSRKKHAQNRWKEHPSEEFWNDVIWKINQSEFCLGNNNRGWKADFDFLVRPDTAAKVLEGKYAGKQQPKKQVSLLEKLEQKNQGENREPN
jgi:hypothetical protein